MERIGTLVFAWLALLALLAATIAGSFVLNGMPSLFASLSIAAIKVAIIYWLFMHLREETGLIRLVAIGVMAWVAILFLLTGIDYAGQ